jgi:anti-sigma-K factor RskA
MPEDVIDTSDTDVLAGEYVLGTLDPDERAAAHNLISADAAFAAKVKVWERRLGELHLMVEPIEPEGDVWPRIKARLPEPQPQPEPATTLPEFNLELEPEPEPGPKEERAAELGLPSPFEPTATPEPASGPADAPATPSAEHVAENGKAAEAPPADVVELPSWQPAASEPAVAKPAPPEAPVAEAPVKPPATAPAPMPSFIPPKAEPTAATIEIAQKLRSVRRHLAGWRVLAAVMALALVALAGLVAVWRYAPERVPPVLRPVALMRLAGISVDTGALPRRPLPPESQFEE